jgi:tetratricopeptide (TPR) repeat protein
MYEALRAEGSIGEWTGYVADGPARRELLVTAMDSLTGVLRVRQLTGSWPFQPRGSVVPLDLPEEGADAIETLAIKQFKREINRQDALDQLREYYLQRDEYHEALKAVLALIQRYPFAHQPYLSAASIMVEQRRLPEALVYVDASLDRLETVLGLELKGSVLLASGKNDEAIPVLRRAVELRPGNVNTMYNLAGGLALTGKREEARQLVQQILSLNPDHAGAIQLGRSIGAN